MKINITSVPVEDQAKAHAFYTDILGFVTANDVPAGDYRWLTVSSPDSTGIELLLEPMGFPPARIYQQQLFEAGIPWTSFAVDDMDTEAARLKSLGVRFHAEPSTEFWGKMAVIDDTCGNLIQLQQLGVPAT